MTPQTRRAAEGEAAARRTTCDWAGCSEPTARIVEGWAMCADHVRMHYELEGDTPLTPAQRADAIRELNGRGWTDRQVAEWLDCCVTTVRKRRVELGLPRNPGRVGMPPKPINHGTAAGAAQHYRRGEKPCRECADAYNATKRDQAYQDSRFPRRSA
jgi:hypothetical protein